MGCPFRAESRLASADLLASLITRYQEPREVCVDCCFRPVGRRVRRDPAEWPRPRATFAGSDLASASKHSGVWTADSSRGGGAAVVSPPAPGARTCPRVLSLGRLRPEAGRGRFSTRAPVPEELCAAAHNSFGTSAATSSVRTADPGSAQSGSLAHAAPRRAPRQSRAPSACRVRARDRRCRGLSHRCWGSGLRL